MQDEVREASGPSDIHIIVVQQIQTILKLGGNDQDEENQSDEKKNPQKIS